MAAVNTTTRTKTGKASKAMNRTDGKEEEIDETLSNLHAASSSVREITQHPWKLITGQGVKGDAAAAEDDSN